MSASRSDPKRIAVVVTNPSTYEGDIVRGVLDYNEPDHRWQFTGRHHLPYAMLGEVDFSQVDGVIIPIYERRWMRDIERAGVPVVSVSNIVIDPSWPTVSCDDHATGRVGADYLLQRGFAHFGFVLQGDMPYAIERCAGFQQTLEKQAGRTCHTLVASTNKDADHSKPIGNWLATLPKPISIMAANDELGLQIIETALAMNLRVPDDVAVLGTDNNPWLTSSASVLLSSIEHDFRRIGYLAARTLDQLIHGQAVPSSQLLPPLRVIPRRSTETTITGDPLVTLALRYINDHFAEGISVEDVLEHVECSRTTLESKMKNAMGMTPHAAVCQARVKHAKKLLLQSDLNMNEIAQCCGLQWQSQLNIVFKRITGMTPGQYRQQQRRLRP